MQSISSYLQALQVKGINFSDAKLRNIGSARTAVDEDNLTLTNFRCLWNWILKWKEHNAYNDIKKKTVKMFLLTVEAANMNQVLKMNIWLFFKARQGQIKMLFWSDNLNKPWTLDALSTQSEPLVSCKMNLLVIY